MKVEPMLAFFPGATTLAPEIPLVNIIDPREVADEEGRE